ncbi:MAG: 30S ribosomal protein S17 [Candidatus Spechtbacterales bacterium]
MTNKKEKKENTVNRKKMRGTVVSNKMEKTLVVEVNRLLEHPKYKKRFKKSKKYKAHYEDGEYNIGDKVVIEETRPISKDKRFRVLK